MGILELIKNFIKQKEPPEKEKITMQELPEWLNNKLKKIKTDENNIFVLVKEKISTFTNEIPEKINKK